MDLISRAAAINLASGCCHPANIAKELAKLPSEQRWIPCSEMIPPPEDMYQVPEQRYLCQLEAYGQKKFCVCSRLRGKSSPFWDWYGVPFKDSEVVAWMPLPEPFKEV